MRAKQAKSGAIVLSKAQTKGRGQRENSWESEEGKNLTFSLVYFPIELSPSNQFYITLWVSVSLAQALEELKVDNVKIKWPNDILVNEKKICGLLIENGIKGRFITQSIIGIGFNVNQLVFQNGKATSLSLEKKETFSLEYVMEVILNNLEDNMRLIEKGDSYKLKTSYLSKLFWRNELKPFYDNEGRFQGTIISVDDLGRLIINKGEKDKIYQHKEVQFLY